MHVILFPLKPVLQKVMRAESVPAFGIDVATHGNRTSALIQTLESKNSNNNDNNNNTDKTAIKMT